MFGRVGGVRARKFFRAPRHLGGQQVGGPGLALAQTALRFGFRSLAGGNLGGRGVVAETSVRCPGHLSGLAGCGVHTGHRLHSGIRYGRLVGVSGLAFRAVRRLVRIGHHIRRTVGRLVRAVRGGRLVRGVGPGVGNSRRLVGNVRPVGFGRRHRAAVLAVTQSRIAQVRHQPGTGFVRGVRRIARTSLLFPWSHHQAGTVSFFLSAFCRPSLLCQPVLTVDVVALDLLTGYESRCTQHAHPGEPINGSVVIRTPGVGNRRDGVQERYVEHIRRRIPVRVSHGIGDDDLLVERVGCDGERSEQQAIKVTGIQFFKTDFVKGGSGWLFSIDSGN